MDGGVIAEEDTPEEMVGTRKISGRRNFRAGF